MLNFVDFCELFKVLRFLNIMNLFILELFRVNCDIVIKNFYLLLMIKLWINCYRDRLSWLSKSVFFLWDFIS